MNEIRKVFGGMRDRRLRGIAWHLPATAIAIPALTGLLILLSGCHPTPLDAYQNTDITPSRLFMFSPLQAPPAAAGTVALKVDLGRRLYYDTHLSANNSTSCNSCHQLTKYGVDPGQAVSRGFNHQPGGRNSPTVYNAGLQFAQFWDGRAATLAAQASGPMMNPVEMGMSGPDAVIAYIHANTDYVERFKQAFPDQKDPVTMEAVTAAIANFEEGLVTPARWDEYLKGNEQALSNDEKQGLRVFLQTGCASCHAGAGMGGNSFAKLGTFEDWPDQKSDSGRMGLTRQDRDLMYFKVPLLRNVVMTGPWFHDGKVKTIDESVRLMARYQLGRNLTASEVSSIVTFLNALTGPIPQEFIRPPVPTATKATTTGMKLNTRLPAMTAVQDGE
jgi:cytochrome c peroxidase